MKQEFATKKIVMLAGPGESTNILFHALNQEFGIHRLLVETPVSQQQLLKRRVEKLGWATVVGQVLFKLAIASPLARKSTARMAQIKAVAGFNDQEVEGAVRLDVPSVNSAECIAELQAIQPDLIVVNGTRIISKKVLGSVACTFLNTHAGITPLYRGVHGGYWALANNDPAHCGVSVHVVDAGIDTGSIVAQALIQPNADDNFTTYPLLQLEAGLPLLTQAIRDALRGELPRQAPPAGQSRLWSHPTLQQYLANRRANGTR